MSKRSVAESVILQAIEDMCADGNTRAESLEFFLGDGFSHWARLAGMSRKEQRGLLALLNLPAVRAVKKPDAAQKRRPSYASGRLATASACTL
jgi:hypothetical protein